MGKVLLSGVVPLLKNPAVSVGDLAVGSSAFFNINGTPREFIVVNQGIPSESSLYDTSCAGTWLMMKDCYSQREWNDELANCYGESTIHPWLNETFLDLFDSAVQNAIKQVKIPYGYENSRAVHSDADGLPAKVFLLSGYEVGFSDYYFSEDGAMLDYFRTDATNRRIANHNGTPVIWWTRSTYTNSAKHVVEVSATGYGGNRYATTSQGIRPAIVLPFNAVANDDGTISFE